MSEMRCAAASNTVTRQRDAVRCRGQNQEPSTKNDSEMTCQKDVFRTTGAQHEDQIGAQDEATEDRDRSQFVNVNLKPREIQRKVDFQKK